MHNETDCIKKNIGRDHVKFPPFLNVFRISRNHLPKREIKRGEVFIRDFFRLAIISPGKDLEQKFLYKIVPISQKNKKYRTQIQLTFLK